MVVEKQTEKTVLEYERMVEQDPLELISLYEKVTSKNRTDSSVKELSLYYAKALYFVHRFEDAKEQCLNSIRIAVNNHDYDRLVKHYLILAKCFFHTGEPYRIKACFDISMDYAREAKDGELLVLVCLDFGSYYVSIQAYDQAQNCYETAWKTLQQSSNK